MNLKFFQFLSFGLVSKLYIGVIIGLLFYSFTQIDLGLTLTSWETGASVQRAFQTVGYFNRPLSAWLYAVVLFFLFLFYFLFLYLVSQNRIPKKSLYVLIGIITGILMFSYNAFSYDLFNYIFDAKIITFYKENPYFHKALDYPEEPMLAFMHWTHRTYPYGPIWLLLTVPLSYVGLNYFFPTLLIFKVFISLAYVGSVFFMSKIAKNVFPKYELSSVVFFALNPLILIESLVSAHNDIVMIFFSLLSLYLLTNKKYIVSFVILFLSIGIKFATVLMLPVLIVVTNLQARRKEFSWEKVFIIITVLMLGAIFAASVRTNFQPWYLLYILPFAAFIGRKYYIAIPLFCFSAASLTQYIPYLYFGNWDSPIPQMLQQQLYIATGVSFFLTGAYFLIPKNKKYVS